MNLNDNMDLVPPSPKTSKRIKESLYQDPEITARDVIHLKDWLSKQPHLPQTDDDVFLERFLYGCKYRLSRCKEVLDMYYTVRGAVPELFKSRDPLSREIQESCETVYYALLPKMSPDGYRVTIIGLLDADVDKFNLPVHIKYGFMMIDTHLRMETWCGDVLVLDLKDASLGHLARTSPLLIRKFLLCIQNAFPFRIKGIHFLNVPVFIDKILALIKPFLKKKLRERVHVHTSMDSFLKMFPKEMLPEEYGGQAGSIKTLNDAWKKNVIKHRDWFLAEEARVAEESKRAGKGVNCDELFGVEGSFRKMTID